MGVGSESTIRLMKAIEPSRGFGFRLGISLVAVVGAFPPPAFDPFVILRISEKARFWVAMGLWLAAPAVWIFQTVFAYRHYGKKWRWFLLGAPWALYELMALFLTLVMFLPN